MEKDSQPDSMATVTIKPEYSPSEYSASEPPPAYVKLRSSSVQIAKIIAVTVVVCSVILGAFLLASAYVTANASCRQLEQELEILSEAADRFQGPLQPEALIQEQPITNAKRQVDSLHAEEPTPTTKELNNHVDESSDDSDSESDSDSEEVAIKPTYQPNVPGQMNMDELISHLMEKNQKAKMNCVVEKKKAEEFVDHQPKTIRLPFGINLTTNPRFEKLTGERMVIVCESGTMQSAERPIRPKEEDSEDQDEETIMIQPMMIPIPQTSFNSHMPQQMPPMSQQRQEQMRPMVPQIFHIENMRPPLPPMMTQQDQEMNAQPQIQIHMEAQQPQQQQNDFPPNPILQHIVQQIVAQKIIESQRLREQQMKEQQEQDQTQPQTLPPNQTDQTQDPEDRPRFIQIEQGQRLPIPEEVLTQLNRLPMPNRVIVAVSETDSDEAPQDIQFVQQQRQNANEVNGRQTYGRGLPIDIPVAMTPQEPESQEQGKQEPDARPHHLQPRSV